MLILYLFISEASFIHSDILSQIEENQFVPHSETFSSGLSDRFPARPQINKLFEENNFASNLLSFHSKQVFVIFSYKIFVSPELYYGIFLKF